MEEKKPTRRKRYSGLYPKKYSEKYKEKNPEKYQETVQRVMEKGNTPAGSHRPIMVDEILSFLDIKKDEIGVDLTLGFGGHSQEILKKLNHTGHLYGVDQDPIELPKTKNRLESLGYDLNDFTLHNLNFKDIDLIGVDGFDFVLADLGVSSMQIDNPERGFTFREDGPLEVRMNPDTGVTAHIRLLGLSEFEIEYMLIENSDEVYAKEIAAEITKEKQQGRFIQTTKELYNVIGKALHKVPKSIYAEELKRATSRTFQALRIDVNNEFEVLYELLDKLPKILKKEGRVAILTFHSGEDRLVKKAFRQYYNEGVFKFIDGPLIPTKDEVFNNPRSRSAKLRVAIKS